MPNIEPLKCPNCAANIQLSDRECPSCGATLPGVSQEKDEAITPIDEILGPTRPDESQEKEGDVLDQIFGEDEVVETEPAQKSPPEETVPSPFPPPTVKPKKRPEAAETIRSPFPPPNVKGERKRKQKPPEPQKSSSKKWLVILAILAVISLLSCAGFAVFSLLF
jgi:hypothetical protein